MNDSTIDAKNTISDKDKKDDENNVTLTTEQLLMLEDQRRELADLRRQVVFLQVIMELIFNYFLLCFCRFFINLI